MIVRLGVEFVEMASHAIAKRKTETELSELETSTPSKRAERRKTRRTQRIEQWLDAGTAEQHQQITFDDESDDSSVNENYDVESLPDSIPDQLTWRGRMQVELHSHWFHLVIVIFVVLDALIVLFELLLDVGAFGNRNCRGETSIEQAEFCHFDQRGDSCAPHAQLLLRGLAISESPGAGIGEEGLCSCKFDEGKRVCAPDGFSGGVDPSLILHCGSLAILCIFMIEILLKLIAFRLKYFTHKFEVFDGIIVVVSFVLDIASLREEEAFEAASLLILLRLWRVVRIVNGAVLSAKSQSDQELQQAREEGRKIIHAFHKCQDRLDDTEDEVARLRRKLKEKESMEGVRMKRGHDPVPYTKLPGHDDTAEEGEKDDWGVAEEKGDRKAAAMKESDIHIDIDPDKTHGPAAERDIELDDLKPDADADADDEGDGGKLIKSSDIDNDEVTQC